MFLTVNRIKQIISNLVLIFLLQWFMAQKIIASEYVMPYPSYMPGNKLYLFSRAWDKINQWWYWGSFATIKYHLRLSDKYLIEAKILFEYKQYLLGVDALSRSDEHFKLIIEALRNAVLENKNIIEFKQSIVEVTAAHINILTKLKTEVPAEFIWQPEKQKPSTLFLGQLLKQAIEYRLQILSDVSKL